MGFIFTNYSYILGVFFILPAPGLAIIIYPGALRANFVLESKAGC